MSEQASMALVLGSAYEQQKGMTGMYQLGYLDGYCRKIDYKTNTKRKMWERIKISCQDDFIKRFKTVRKIKI